MLSYKRGDEILRWLITGGAGSLGGALCKKLIEAGHYVRSMDINEYALAQQNYSLTHFTKIYGDISNYSRIKKAMRGVDVVVHTAAMKNLLVTEHNAPDCIRINVMGTLNVSEAAMELGIPHVIFISSDKSVAPTTLYGSTKQDGEHICKAAGRIQDKTKFTIIRSGNFFQSAGNVFETWEREYKEGKPLTLTDLDMQRYFIEVNDLCEIIMDLPTMNETIIPFMKEYYLMDLLIMKYGEEQPFILTGLRQGEKLREQLRYPDEKTIEINNFYEVVA